MKKIILMLMLIMSCFNLSAQNEIVRRSTKAKQSSKTTTSQNNKTHHPNTTTHKIFNYIPEHAIDLGLPSGTLWSDRNLGASTESDYGNYFAYGDVKPERYIGFSKESNYPNKNIVRSNMDAATYYLGGEWHMPTCNQAKELVKFCKWKETKIGDKYGYKITGPNGNSIFLPSAGWLMFPGGQKEPDYGDQGSRGNYWCGEVNHKEKEGNAYQIYFATDGHSWHYVTTELRWMYNTIRPVWD